jgi:4-hydroxymandelate oxidase
MQKVGQGVAILKPRADHAKIGEMFAEAAACGAIVVGIDVDGAGLITMKLGGQPVGPKTIDALLDIKSQTQLPSIVKGA